jgi:hypothetical protein
LLFSVGNNCEIIILTANSKVSVSSRIGNFGSYKRRIGAN